MLYIPRATDLDALENLVGLVALKSFELNLQGCSKLANLDGLKCLARLSALQSLRTPLELLVTKQRPPRQNVNQNAAVQQLLADAKSQSDAAKPQVIDAIEKIRSQLLSPYNTYTSEQLLEMFSWEFKRLPIYHNGPLDAAEQTKSSITDDTVLNVTLKNGYIQNVCQRYVLGG